MEEFAQVAQLLKDAENTKAQNNNQSVDGDQAGAVLNSCDSPIIELGGRKAMYTSAYTLKDGTRRVWVIVGRLDAKFGEDGELTKEFSKEGKVWLSMENFVKLVGAKEEVAASMTDVIERENERQACLPANGKRVSGSGGGGYGNFKRYKQRF